jgi:hypothetical protein
MSEAKVYGIQRSGNNLLMWLLAANFKVRILGNKFGWTHGPMKIVKTLGHAPAVVLLAVKHPLCWLPSIHRHRGKGAFGAYVEKSKEIEKWNERYTGWLNSAAKLNGTHFQICRYEDWLSNTVGHLEELWGAAGLERKDGPWKMAKSKMNKHMGFTGNRFDADYYLSRRYMSTYPRRIVRMVAKRVDQDLLERLGYRRMK